MSDRQEVSEAPISSTAVPGCSKSNLPRTRDREQHRFRLTPHLMRASCDNPYSSDAVLSESAQRSIQTSAGAAHVELCPSRSIFVACTQRP
jgi:hypothetical protein